VCYNAFLVFGCVLPVCWILECAVACGGEVAS
jgi:hypothetical protein